ncbi:MAG: preprotein translocase subunit SecD [bacterium]
MKPVRTRVILITVLIIISLFSIVPSIYPNTPSWWKAAIGNAEMHLGLDLQGGLYLIEKVETNKAINDKLYKDYSDIAVFAGSKGFNKNNLVYNKNYLLVKGKLLKNNSLLMKFISKRHPSLKLVKNKIIFKKSAVALFKKEAVSGALEVMRNRIDQFGLINPNIARQGKNTIVLELPGVKNVKQAVSLIGKTARLTFQLVNYKHSLKKISAGNIPKGYEILYHTTYNKYTHKTIKIPYLINKTVLMS